MVGYLIYNWGKHTHKDELLGLFEMYTRAIIIIIIGNIHTSNKNNGRKKKREKGNQNKINHYVIYIIYVVAVEWLWGYNILESTMKKSKRDQSRVRRRNPSARRCS